MSTEKLIYDGYSVSKEEQLDGRDAQMYRRCCLMMMYQLPMITFTINTPGPVKLNDQTLWLHAAGNSALLVALARESMIPIFSEIRNCNTGPESFFVVKTSAPRLKVICYALEITHKAGRLFNFNVYEECGHPIGRSFFKWPPRTCMICGGNVSECRKEHRHTRAELQAAFDEIARKAGYVSNRI